MDATHTSTLLDRKANDNDVVLFELRYLSGQTFTLTAGTSVSITTRASPLDSAYLYKSVSSRMAIHKAGREWPAPSDFAEDALTFHVTRYQV